MIETLAIKSFKSLLDVKVELGRVNVFVGANGSGKSNLLEALGVLGAAAGGRVDDEALIRRGVRPGLPSLYKSSFHGVQKTRGSVGLSATEAGAEYAVELNNPLKNPEPAWRYATERLDDGDERLVGRSPHSRAPLDPQRGLAALKAVELAITSPGSKLLGRLSNYAIYQPATLTLRGQTPDAQAREPVGLAGGRLPEAVRALLGHHPEEAAEALGLIDWAASVSTRKVGSEIPLSPSVASSQQVLYFKDRFTASGREGLTGYDASEGALYVLFAAVLAVMPSAPLTLAIDNVDHGLNPRLARALMEHICRWVLSSQDRQLLLTTHNPLVLDGLPLDDDNVRLFAVGRSRKGRTTVSRIRVSLDELQRDGELWTVSRQWVMGHLGGMPDV